MNYVGKLNTMRTALALTILHCTLKTLTQRTPTEIIPDVSLYAECECNYASDVIEHLYKQFSANIYIYIYIYIVTLFICPLFQCSESTSQYEFLALSYSFSRRIRILIAGFG